MPVVHDDIDPLLAEPVFERKPEPLGEAIHVHRLQRVKCHEQIDVAAKSAGIRPGSEQNDAVPDGTCFSASLVNRVSNTLSFVRRESRAGRSGAHSTRKYTRP